MTDTAVEDSLCREQAFFDAEAAALTDNDLTIDPSQFRRYREARLRSSNTSKDTLFARMQPLAGSVQDFDYLSETVYKRMKLK